MLRANAIVTSANSLYTPGELAHQLADSGAGSCPHRLPVLDRARARSTEAGLPEDAVITLDAVEGVTSLADLLASTAGPNLETTTTAGQHRGAAVFVGDHRPAEGGDAHALATWWRMCVRSTRGWASAPTTRLLAVLPFFHIYGMTVLLNAALYNRASLVTMPKFDLVEFLSIVSGQRCTYVFIAPPVAVALAKHPLVDDYDLSSVHSIFSGAAPLDQELGKAVANRLGCRVRQGYGMSEMSPVSHAIPFDRDDIALDSVGLVDREHGVQAGRPGHRGGGRLPGGRGQRAGELWCKGPNIMAGYLGNDEATAETLDADGYLHTGRHRDRRLRGAVTIVDRMKELIKYKGYQVPPAELEALLLTHPQIADAAVIGVLDDEGEEVPKAFVVRQPGAELDEAAVIAFVAERVSPHKKVRKVEFIDLVPKSAAGKILRKDLRAREATKA